MKKTDLVAAVAGALFAVGLGLSGMTQPSKVIAFLDVRGAWDPSLAFVMVGAIGVHCFFVRRMRPAAGPLLAPRYALPTVTRVDARLIVGASLFGVGWGIAGYCPGPAVVSVATRSPDALAFVAAMLAGMLVHAILFGRDRQPDARDDASSWGAAELDGPRA